MLTPSWRLIFTSKPAIAIFVSHVGANWGNYLFLTQIPTYMKEILRFDIESVRIYFKLLLIYPYLTLYMKKILSYLLKNGLFSSVPYICSLFFAAGSSLLADYLIKSERCSKTAVRKIFNSVAFYASMVAVLLLSQVTCAHPYLGVLLLAFGVGFLACATGAGFLVNINEISGSYSSVLFGISNTFGTISGIVAPYLVGLLTPNVKFISTW
jgi:ACS family sodium-dependent inorganic phosphate cotransporter-like MFS transporter 5